MKTQNHQQLTMPWRKIAPGVRIPEEVLIRAAELFAEQLIKIWKGPQMSEHTDEKEKCNG